MSKPRRTPTCEICKEEPAVWYWQTIAGDEAFYRPGYHIRGFHVTKICDKCKQDIQDIAKASPDLRATPPA